MQERRGSASLMIRRQTFPIAALVASTAFVAPSAHAAETNHDAEFTTLVNRGDKARSSGQWVDAAHAYAEALELRDDPLVSGRVGLVLVELRHFDVAAQRLLHAIEDNAGASDAERTRFVRAFQTARDEVCKLNVTIDHRGARFEVDGQVQEQEKGDFVAFVGAGVHTLRVSLEGFEDETREITAPRGGLLKLAFSMRPRQQRLGIASTALPPLTANGSKRPVLHQDKLAATNVTSRSNGQFIAGLGAILVLGVTPTPALGPQIFAAWRSHSWWEVGLDLRAAWTFVHDDQFPNSNFFTWSAIIAPCGRLRDRWFGCVLIEADGVEREGFSRSAFLPGFGLRGGGEFALHKRLRFQVSGDAVFHPRGVAVRGKTPWNSSLVTGVFGLRAVFFF